MLRSASLASPLAGYDPCFRVSVGAGVAGADGFRLCAGVSLLAIELLVMSLLGTLSGQVQPTHYWLGPPSAYISERAILEFRRE
jgi:hypothetical protein